MNLGDAHERGGLLGVGGARRREAVGHDGDVRRRHAPVALGLDALEVREVRGHLGVLRREAAQARPREGRGAPRQGPQEGGGHLAPSLVGAGPRESRARPAVLRA